MGPLSISDEMAKTITHNKIILLLSRNISQTVSGDGADVIRKTYPSGKQYMAFPETKDGRGDLDTFARRRAARIVGKW